MEGGANVIPEAVVADVPVIASGIDGNVGLLGEDYPGYYPVENRGIMHRAETALPAAFAPNTCSQREAEADFEFMIVASGNRLHRPSAIHGNNILRKHMFTPEREK